ncbi:MAG: FtsQ-type POTRA domain-containing protein, partial [Deltaproteobacteria bacterium]|nr:FtsQ-type POTRA domain-containing protein [Deltaproteobacteria bacterium]
MARSGDGLRRLIAGQRRAKPRKIAEPRSAASLIGRRRAPERPAKRPFGLFLKKARPGPGPSPPVVGLSLAALALRGAKLAAFGILGFGVLAALTAILLGGYLYFSKSDHFAVRRLKITGLGRLTMEEAVKAAGLDRPVNNLAFKARAAADSLASLPWVEEAHVSRILPDGLLVEVTEYKPKALVSLDQLYYLDEKGRAFKKLDPGENPDLPIITGFSLDELISGGPLTKEGLNECFQLMDVLAERTDDFRLDSVSELNYDHDLGLTVFTRRSGLRLRVGFGSYGEKFRRL